MQFDEKCLSCGELALPVQRPLGATEWQKWGQAWPEWAEFFTKISHNNWEAFITALEGHFLEDIFPIHERLSKSLNLRAVKKRLKGKENTSQTTGTGCFHGYAGNCVSFYLRSGVRLLWTLRKATDTVYVVDSPSVSACYIFGDKHKAQSWASGRVSWQQAKRNAIARIIHQGSWENRIDSALKKLGVLSSQ